MERLLSLTVTFILDTRRVFIAIVALGFFAMAARNVTDPDVWWHLRTGQLILQNHAVFHTDPYSFTKLGKPWVNHEWLSDVLIFGLYRVSGWAGPIVAFAAITSAAFMLVFLRCSGGPYLAAIFTVWAAIASAPSWGVRPQALSLFLASLFLFLLEKSCLRPHLLWYTLPLMLIWVNLHGGFALGIVLIFLFLVGALLDAAFGAEQWTVISPRVQRLSLALAACLAIVPLNPYGVRMYWYPLQTVHSRTIQNYIDEWSSPNFHQGMYVPAVLLVLATIILSTIPPNRLRPRDLLLLSATTWASLHAVRHIPIFAMVAAPILSNLASAFWRERQRQSEAATKTVFGRSIHPIFNALALAMFLVLGASKVRTVLRTQNAIERRSFPTAAVSFLRVSKLPGNIFNSYNWGGYLIWQLYPEYRVYIDGRTDLYGDAFMDQFAETYQISKSSWPVALEQWRIQTLLVPNDAPIVCALRLRPQWKPVYEDSQAIILTRAQIPPYE